MICHQHQIRLKLLEEDLKGLNFDPSLLSPRNFTLSSEKMSDEIKNFIERYEWLGTIGVNPKWVFTARYSKILSGVILINEPTAYSNILGPDTKKYEALIQRGACISWSPKGLASRLIMFSLRWMVKNTEKRCFVAYSDPEAGEMGTVYQACNFDYLGNNFGNNKMYVHSEFKKGSPFSSQTLRRTSTLRWWAKRNNIVLDKSWFKPNGFKDLESIPEEIKSSWSIWQKLIISESDIVTRDKKGKYVYILGTSRREQKLLTSLKTYSKKEYPKRSA